MTRLTTVLFYKESWMRRFTAAFFAFALLSAPALATTPVFNGNVFSATFPVAAAKFYGVKCDGITDDTTAIQNAINAAEAAGAQVQLPSGICIISSLLTIGNGTTAALSTYNNTGIIGSGSGFFPDGPSISSSTILRWNGVGTGPMLLIQGPITSVQLTGFMLDCNQKCTTGIKTISMRNSVVTDVYTENNLVSGSTPAWYMTAYCNPPGGGSQANLFENFGVYDNSENNGLTMMQVGEATTAGCTAYYDVSNNTFINPILSGYGTSTDVGISLNFTDNNYWVRGIIATGGNTKSVVFNVVPGYTSFPGSQFFDTVGVDGISVNGTPANPNAIIGDFTNYYGTTPPANSGIWVSTDFHQLFYPLVSAYAVAGDNAGGGPNPVPSPCATPLGGRLCLSEQSGGGAHIYMGSASNNAVIDYNYSQVNRLTSSVPLFATSFGLNGTTGVVLAPSGNTLIISPPGAGFIDFYAQGGGLWAHVNSSGVYSDSGIVEGFSHNLCASGGGWPCYTLVGCSLSSATTCSGTATVPSGSFCTGGSDGSDTTTGVNSWKFSVSTTTLTGTITVSASQTSTAHATVHCL